MWYKNILMVGAILCAASSARAEDPVTTVWFGTPAGWEVTVNAPPAPPPPRLPSPWERYVAALPDPGASEPAPAASSAVSAIETPAPNDTTPSDPEPQQASLSTGRCPPAITVMRRMDSRIERIDLQLLDCEGVVSDEALIALSVLARPRSAERPSDEDIARWRTGEGDREYVASDVRVLDRALVERLARIGAAFEGHAIEIVSAYRPDSREQSRHHQGRALDLFVHDVPREAVRDLAVTFRETGVGWYPNSTFVHIDVREESTYWVDLSSPGEAPRYARAELNEADASPAEIEAIRSEAAAAVRELSAP